MISIPVLYVNNVRHSEESGTSLADIRQTTSPSAYLTLRADSSYTIRRPTFILQDGVEYELVVPPQPTQDVVPTAEIEKLIASAVAINVPSAVDEVEMRLSFAYLGLSDSRSTLRSDKT